MWSVQEQLCQDYDRFGFMTVCPFCLRCETAAEILRHELRVSAKKFLCGFSDCLVFIKFAT